MQDRERRSQDIPGGVGQIGLGRSDGSPIVASRGGGGGPDRSRLAFSTPPLSPYRPRQPATDGVVLCSLVCGVSGRRPDLGGNVPPRRTRRCPARRVGPLADGVAAGIGLGTLSLGARPGRARDRAVPRPPLLPGEVEAAPPARDDDRGSGRRSSTGADVRSPPAQHLFDVLAADSRRLGEFPARSGRALAREPENQAGARGARLVEGLGGTQSSFAATIAKVASVIADWMPTTH